MLFNLHLYFFERHRSNSYTLVFIQMLCFGVPCESTSTLFHISNMKTSSVVDGHLQSTSHCCTLPMSMCYFHMIFQTTAGSIFSFTKHTFPSYFYCCMGQHMIFYMLTHIGCSGKFSDTGNIYESFPDDGLYDERRDGFLGKIFYCIFRICILPFFVECLIFM